MNRANANFTSLIVASLVGVGIVLLLEGSSKPYSSLTIVLAVFTFGSVIAAAMMIAWAAEASQFSISQGLALAIVAIVQTLLSFSWRALSHGTLGSSRPPGFQTSQRTSREQTDS